MKDKEIKYYRIKPLNLIGRKTDAGYELFRNGEWVTDTGHLISDRLMGYDPGEPEGSPYAIGNTDIMDEIEEISMEETKNDIQ